MCSGLVAMTLAGRRLQRLGGAVDVGAAGARERADHAVLDLLRDLVDGAEVALGRDREAGLDHVHAHLLEHLRDLQLLGDGHGGAGRLLAVAQRGVEDDDTVSVRRSVGGGRGGYVTGRVGRHRPVPFWRRVDASLLTLSPEHARTGCGSGAAKSKLRRKEAGQRTHGTRSRGAAAADQDADSLAGRVHARLGAAEGAYALSRLRYKTNGARL
jgi:hypothetical protein